MERSRSGLEGGKKGAPLKETDLDGVKEAVSLVILHADLTRDSLECFKQLALSGAFDALHDQLGWNHLSGDGRQ